MFVTTEHTRLTDLVKMRSGITGTFLVKKSDRDKLLRLAHSYAVRNKSKVSTESASIILRGEEVWWVVFVTVEEAHV